MFAAAVAALTIHDQRRTTICGEPPVGAAPVPQRIVSLAPSITEILFAVGAGDRVVGVTSHCDYPPAVTRSARIGGYNTPNVEIVVSMKPDLVLAPREGAILAAFQQLRDFGLRVEDISVATLADLGPAVERTAILAGIGWEGRKLATDLQHRIAAVLKAAEGRPRPRALLVVDREPTIAAGEGTFGDDLLRAAGAENVVRGTLSRYPELGLEAIIAAAPEVIIDASMAPGDDAERARVAQAFWARYGSLPAVRDGRVLTIDPDLVVRPGPRLVDGLERLAFEIHRR